MNQLVGRRYRTKTEEGLSQRAVVNPRINNWGGGRGRGKLARRWDRKKVGG